MTNAAIAAVSAAADYIERRLDDKLGDKIDLAAVASAAQYSKYHLHRMFGEITGQTLHAYVQRRRLTEAARLLVHSDWPLLEIALISGYASQQAFHLAFKAMYKLPPAEYRKRQEFYPLQLPLQLQAAAQTAQQPRPAKMTDIPAWLDLARQSVAGYPHWHEDFYCRQLCLHIAQGQAVIWPSAQGIAAAMAFSAATGCIDFLAVQPQYRRRSLAKNLLHTLRRDILPRRAIHTTTFRADDKAETGQRATLERLGFAAEEPQVEFGYPTQLFRLANNLCEVKYYV